jgi:hypothetical protein
MFAGLAHLGMAEIFGSFTRAAERSRQATDLAERHGWSDEPAAGTAYLTLAAVTAWITPSVRLPAHPGRPEAETGAVLTPAHRRRARDARPAALRRRSTGPAEPSDAGRAEGLRDQLKEYPYADSAAG